MVEGLQRLRQRRGCPAVLSAALVAAVFFAGAGPAPAQAPTQRLVPPSPAPSPGDRLSANTVAIVSGDPSATYLAIAYDLSAVLDKGDEFRVLPIVGKGGAQNVRDVRLLKGVDLGVTQAAILNGLRRSKELGPLDDKIVYLAKLFNEEMHIVVRADGGVNSVAQLDGKKVNFSEAGSGTQATARDVFGRLGLKPIEVNMGQADAVEKLKSGEIAATVLIAGRPAGAMARLSAAEGFRLLPTPFAKPLQADYLPATLTSEDYPNLIEPGAAIETIAVDAILFANNWPRNTDGYRRIEKFVQQFFPRLADFQKPPRHPKWKETNLAAAVPGWTRFPAAEEWLKRNGAAEAAAREREQRQQFDRFLATRLPGGGEAMTTAERDQLFKDFLKWNETRERQN